MYYIMSKQGGAWEDEWYVECVVVGRENADKLFDKWVESAQYDAENYNPAEYITLQEAVVSDNGRIVPKEQCKYLREWEDGRGEIR